MSPSLISVIIGAIGGIIVAQIAMFLYVRIENRRAARDRRRRQRDQH